MNVKNDDKDKDCAQAKLRGDNLGCTSVKHIWLEFLKDLITFGWWMTMLAIVVHDHPLEGG